MAKNGKSIADRSFPWWQSGFDLEGVVGFLAGWLLGILLGMLWGPLFWIGFLPGIVILFATRTAERVSPSDESSLLAPCDGVVVSVEQISPPAELGLSGNYKRVRISSSPFATNNIHAPIAGSVDLIEREEGAAEAFMALRPDAAGLEGLYLTLSGKPGQVGIRVATGGLGPRLHAKADSGDWVSAGATIATRRLGGWCDVYLPATGSAQVVPGRTLIGGESVLWRFDIEASAEVIEEVEVETVDEEEDEPTELDGDDPVSDEDAAEAADIEPDEEDDASKEKSGDAAEAFARLRREASKLQGETDQD